LLTLPNFTTIFIKLNYISNSTLTLLELFYDKNIHHDKAICKFMINIMYNQWTYKPIIDNIYSYVSDKQQFPKLLVDTLIENHSTHNKKITNQVTSTVLGFISIIIETGKFKPNREFIKSLTSLLSLYDNMDGYFKPTINTDILTNNSDNLTSDDAKLIFQLRHLNISNAIDYFITKIHLDEEAISYICLNISDTHSCLYKHIVSNNIQLSEKNCIIMIKEYISFKETAKYYDTLIIDIVTKIVTHYTNHSPIISQELFRECCKDLELTELLLGKGYIPTNDDLDFCTKSGCSSEVLQLIINTFPQQVLTSTSVISEAISNKNAEAICFAIENGILPTIDEFYEIFYLVKKIDTIQRLINNGFNLDNKCLEIACSVTNNNKLIEYIINSGIDVDEMCIHALCNSQCNDNIIKKLIHRKFKFTLINLKDANCRYRGKRLINDMIHIVEY
jgi:hypothetical protein